MRDLERKKNRLDAFFRKKELKKVTLLCCLGFSEEVFLASKKWREENQERVCIFIEEDPKVKNDFFKKKNASLYLEAPQVEIYFLETPLQLEPLLKKICWSSPFSQKELVCFQTKEKRKRFKEAYSLMEMISMGVELTFSEFSDFGLRTFSNIFQNLFRLKEIKDFSHLQGAFANIPAIVCGAGPSLKDNLPLFKKMKNRALLFAGGSALNVLSSHCIPFHFAASVDKDAPYERFLMQTSFETPFFFQNQISSLNLSRIHAPLIRVGGYSDLPLEKWLDEKCKIFSGPFDGGWTVATFLLSLAHFLGCDPIVMVGMDFSFEKNLYAGGVLVEEGVKRESLVARDRNGNEVWTQKDWLLARSWIEEFAKKANASIIDASLGLSFRGVKRACLQALSNGWKKSFDLSGQVHARVASIPTIALSEKKVDLLLDAFAKSLSRVAHRIDKEIQRTGKRNAISFEAIEKALFKEKSYDLLLEPLWKIWRHLFEKNASLQEISLHRILFFKRVVAEYRQMIATIGRCA